MLVMMMCMKDMKSVKRRYVSSYIMSNYHNNPLAVRQARAVSTDGVGDVVGSFVKFVCIHDYFVADDVSVLWKCSDMIKVDSKGKRDFKR